MFLGEFQHTIDTKGRLAIPARYRADLQRGAVLVRGIEPCLYVYTMETWEEKALELKNAKLDAKTRRQMERRFFGTAFEAELDAQGRIVVPVGFRRYADLSGETTIVGAYQRFEIWSRARWDEQLAEMGDADLSGIELPF